MHREKPARRSSRRRRGRDRRAGRTGSRKAARFVAVRCWRHAVAGIGDSCRNRAMSRATGADLASVNLPRNADFPEYSNGIIDESVRRSDSMKATLYEALGIPPTASDEEVRAALRRLIRKYYAKTRDGQGNVEEALRFINHASRILSDPDRRVRYDERARALRRARPSSGSRTSCSNAVAATGEQDRRRSRRSASSAARAHRPRRRGRQRRRPPRATFHHPGPDRARRVVRPLAAS